MPRPDVRHTLEYERIAALPRRQITLAAAEAWADVLTEELAVPGSGASLRPWQALAVAEVADNDGGFLALPVGIGKTIPLYVLARLLEAKRPLVIVKGRGLVHKTRGDFASYVGQWRSPNPPPHVITLESLHGDGAKYLWEFKPDYVALDEVHNWANPEASHVRAMDRYVREVREADGRLVVVAATGTPTRKSLMNIWHLLWWCLPNGAPLPETQAEAESWAAALDHFDGRRADRARRPGPGPLGHTVKEAREWLRQRIAETPGVVIIDGDSCDKKLTIRTRLAREDAKIDGFYEKFLKEFEGPFGEIVTDPLSRWRIDMQMGSGVALKFKKPPPEEWLSARRALGKFVRKAIERSTDSRPIYTERQAIRRYPTHPAVLEWLRVRDSFKPETVAEWLSSSGIESVRDWLAESDRPGVVWTGVVEFARALSVATRLPYYGREGCNDQGRNLRDADPRRSLIASWGANKEGYNLQAWKRQLVVHPPQSALYLEQLFGRGHRSLQDSDVTVDVLCTSGGSFDALDSAIGEAGFAKSIMTLTQKILRAEVVRVRPAITKSNRFRWATRG